MIPTQTITNKYNFNDLLPEFFKKESFMNNNNYNNILKPSYFFNKYVEISGRQTGKTIRLIERAILESYANNVIIFVNRNDGKDNLRKILNDKLFFTLKKETTEDLNNLQYTPFGCKNTFSEYKMTGYNVFNYTSDKVIHIVGTYTDYLKLINHKEKYSLFFDEADFNSNLLFLERDNMLKDIPKNGLLYLSTTLKNFLTKEITNCSPKDNSMQWAYENFGIDVKIKNPKVEKVLINRGGLSVEDIILESGQCIFKIINTIRYE